MSKLPSLSAANVLNMLDEQVRLRRCEVAVMGDDGQLTYGELESRSNQLARHLQRRGIQAETPCALCVDRSTSMVVGLVAILKAGGAYVPLDSGYPIDRLQFILHDSRTRLIVTQSSIAARLPHEQLDTICLDGDWSVIANEPAERPPIAIRSTNLAYVIYTSGSTGVPKGVMIQHGSLENLVQAVRHKYELTPADRILQFASLSFDASAEQIFSSLTSGATLILRTADMIDTTEQFFTRCGQSGVTVANLPTAYWHQLMLSLADKALLLPSCLRLMIVGGEKLSAHHVAIWQSRVGPRVRLINAYGPTETTVTAAEYDVIMDTLVSPQSREVPIGKPLDNVHLYILDDAQRPVAAGAVGEICIGGAGLARGYLLRPDLTATCFIPNPFSAIPGQRLYRSGDTGRILPDGNVECLGRRDDQVKIRGYRIELGEVEAALASHPAVHQVVVVARDDTAGKQLVAYWVGNAKGYPGVRDLRMFLAQKLPDYMIPSAFVALDTFPVAPGGKIDRHALPVPNVKLSAPGSVRRAPQNSLEDAVAKIFADVLRIDNIDVDDDFFELGGHSLMATQVLARIRDTLHAEISLGEFFSARTVAAVAAIVSGVRESLSHPLLRPLPRGGYLPTSFSQERVWFVEQLAPGCRAYQLQTTLHFKGRLDPEMLEASLNAIIARHEIFRTTFNVIDGRPMQQIHAPWRVQLPLEDLSGTPLEARDEAIRQVIDAQIREPFDLRRLPLIRWTLIRTSTDEHILLHVEHHLLHDGWSFNVFLGELVQAYRTFSRGEEPQLPPLPIQFADFAAWQREYMTGEVLQRHLEYWRTQLSSMPPTLELTDHARPPVQTFNGASIRTAFPETLCGDLRRIAHQEQVTLFMVLLAAFQVLLQGYTGEDDIVVGSTVANRQRKEAERLIGMLVNSVALRTDLSGNPTFTELLARVRSTALGAYDHQDAPFDSVVHMLGLPHDSSRNPLFQITFNFHDSLMPDLALPDVEIGITEALSNGSAKFDLNVTVFPRAEQHAAVHSAACPSGIDLIWEYNTDLFDSASVRRMIERYQRLLEDIVEDPTRRLSALSVVTNREFAWLLAAGYGKRSEPLTGPCVHELIEAQASQRPEAIAVIDDHEFVTYEELNRRANALARCLQREGVSADVPVLLWLDRSLELVVGILAVLKAGGAFVMLDPALPDERVRFIAEDVGVGFVLTKGSLLPRARKLGLRSLQLDRLLHHPEAAAPEIPLPRVKPDNLAYITYTSGSTGVPKGVLNTHRGLANRLFWSVSAGHLVSGDRVLQKTSLNFDAAVWELLAPLVSGAAIVLVPFDAHLDPSAVVSAVQQYGISVLQAVPTAWSQVVEDTAIAECRSLRLAFSAGEPLTRDLANRIVRRAKVDLWNTYGPAECSIDSTAWRYRDDTAGAIPIGTPIDNVGVLILDRFGRLAPIGVAGELHVAGSGLARGYLGRPDLTAERFVPHPHPKVPGERAYRTGDIARWRSDGLIELLGRIDDQVKIRGVRIEPGEIEAALRQHSDILDAVVCPSEDAFGDKTLIAYVVVKNDGDIAHEELRRHLSSFMPDYMVPTSFTCVDRFPTTISGKVDRKALARLSPRTSRSRAPYQAPGTVMEELVAGIWASVLAAGRIGINDNFFDLGGHSLLATRIVSRLREAFRMQFPLSRFFEVPTVAGNVAEIEATGSSNALTPIPASPHEGPMSLSFAQERLWFLDQLEPGSTEYLVPVAMRMRGRLDISALKNALTATLARHEILRTRYIQQQGQPFQVVEAPRPLDLNQVELKDENSQTSDLLRTIALRETWRPFDLRHDRPLRACLVRLAQDEHVLLIVVHHIAFDGWSMAVLVRELGQLYAAFVEGRPASLAPLAIQYADFAMWQREWLTGEVLQRQGTYWREKLNGVSPLELPADRPRPSVRTAEGASVTFEIPQALGQALIELGRQRKATPFMVFLAAFQALLARYSGQTDIAVGTPIAGRNRSEVQDLIGCFVNTLVIRTDLSDDPSFITFLDQVRATALDAYDHQDLPFERLVQELQPDRDLSRNPLFQVMFALQDDLGAFGFANLAVEPLRIDWGTAKFDLTLSLERTATTGVRGRFEYATPLFDQATVERMVDHFIQLLMSVAEHPTVRLSQMEILTADERQKLAVEWVGRDTPRVAPLSSVHEQVQKTAANHPDAPAVLCGEQRLSYAELNSRANRLAHHLHALGADTETRVGVLLDRGTDAVIAFLAILKAGAVYVPLDPGYPTSRLNFILMDSASRFVITRHPHHDRLSASDARVIDLDADSQSISTQPMYDPTRTPHMGSLAYIIYTSGSTGTPKGVAVEHRAYAHHCAAIAKAYELDRDDKLLLLSSVAFDMSLDIMAALSHGAAVVMSGPEFWSPTELLAEISSKQVTVVEITPAYFREVMRDVRPRDERLRSLRLLDVGGDSVQAADANGWRSADVEGRFLSSYGPTEATVTSTLYRLEQGNGALRLEGGVPLGRPLPGTQVWVLDSDLHLVPIGIPGELCIGGPRLARGYVGLPDLTAQRFVPNPFGDSGSRLYRTGDRVRHLADGNLEFLGRFDNQVKVRGFRIELGEIESALTQHPHVHSVAVVARETQPGDKQLVAYVVPRDGCTLRAADLKAFLGSRLPIYMVPTGWVTLNALPLTASKKVDRAALPSPTNTETPAGLKDSSWSSLEVAVANVWIEVLKLDHVGLHDDFFALGGHSLLATRLLAVLQERFSIALSLRELFEATTVAVQAALVRETMASRQLHDGEQVAE
jgi:amino acid adenylation domain-containing protein